MQRSGRIVIAGHALEFESLAAARPHQPTLVFLHEGLGSLGLWRGFPGRIAERTGCGALVYSRYGNGFSDPLDQPRSVRYMHDEALVVLPAMLEACHIESTVLFGHSDGGSIALVYAGAFPQRVRALVVEAPHVFVEDLTVRSIAAIRQAYETTDLRTRMSCYHADADRTFYGWNDAWLAPEFRTWNIESYLSTIRAPLLAVQGTADEYGSASQIDAVCAGVAQRVDRLYLADCGHAPHAQRQQFVESAAAHWIAETLEQ